MKKIVLRTIILLILLLFACSLIIVLFNTPQLLSWLGGEPKSNTGSFIGGVTAPLLSIISSIFLYLALTKQIESNQQQQLKNESDIIFLLLNQLETELGTFYHSGSRDKTGPFRFEGIEALERFSTALRIDYELGTYEKSFKTFYESSQIILLIRSYRLIERRIAISPLDNEMKGLFTTKLQTFFITRLEIAVTTITQAVAENPVLLDDVAQEIIEFGKAQEDGRSVLKNIKDR